jgi:hypothetical protein
MKSFKIFVESGGIKDFYYLHILDGWGGSYSDSLVHYKHNYNARFIDNETVIIYGAKGQPVEIKGHNLGKVVYHAVKLGLPEERVRAEREIEYNTKNTNLVVFYDKVLNIIQKLKHSGLKSLDYSDPNNDADAL